MTALLTEAYILKAAAKRSANVVSEARCIWAAIGTSHSQGALHGAHTYYRAVHVAYARGVRFESTNGPIDPHSGFTATLCHLGRFLKLSTGEIAQSRKCSARITKPPATATDATTMREEFAMHPPMSLRTRNKHKKNVTRRDII